MTNEQAIETLSMELKHTESHMRIEGKASEYYEELSQIAEALQMSIKALKNKPDYDILFLCDGKACGEDHDCMECKHTLDICHAKNFHYNDVLFDKNYYLEEDSDGKTN